MSIIDEKLWGNGPTPGELYKFPGSDNVAALGPMRHTLTPITTGTSVLGIKFDKGVMIACDTLGSYGSLARYRKVSRVMRVNDTTIMGADGDYADFQFLKSVIEQKCISDRCAGDGFQYTAPSLHSWLTRVLYNRRSKFNPLWNSLVVGGFAGDEPFLGYVNKIGTAYEAPSIATGYGAYIAQPLLRDALDKKPNLTEADAKELLKQCITVLYYRDGRAWNKYEIATVTSDAPAKIEGPLEVTGDWSIATMVKGYE